MDHNADGTQWLRISNPLYVSRNYSCWILGELFPSQQRHNGPSLAQTNLNHL